MADLRYDSPIDICRQSGIDQSSISRWLRGTQMNERSINTIAEAYKLSPGMALDIINARRAAIAAEEGKQ